MPGRAPGKSLRRRVAAAARYRCGYCLVSESTTAVPLHLDHLTPVVAGGLTVEENLWLACPLCNGHKGDQQETADPDSHLMVPLFNPRTQSWSEHFRWSDNGLLILGLTAIGRGTVVALKLNNEYFLQSRRRWIEAGWHPPEA